ncbi:MAG: AAA family ATPase, partial [Armatimonadetes bacterium]|nr:AAA family ATPase [Armatimonadota bacterium]
MDKMWRVEVFGGLRAVGCGRELSRFRTRKTGALLGYLCLHPDRAHAREELAELLWPGCGFDDGKSSVSTALWSLRRQLQAPEVSAAPVLVADRYAVAVNREVVETDAGVFLHRLRLAGRATTERERAAALGEAIELYHGEVLAGYDEEWLLTARREYQQVYRSAVTDLVDCLLASGQRTLALRYVGQAVRVAPDEGLLDLLAELQAGQPQQAQPERAAAPASRPLPDGTVTFLLAAAGGQADGLARLAAEVQRHQGHTVEEGDSLIAAFACAEDALGCATALHAANPEGLRVALDTGRATPELGRYYAPVLEHAARLLLATGPGQTICSERTASLARLELDPRLRLADLGSYRIPGSDQPERLFQVDATGTAAIELRPPVGLVSSSGNLPRSLNRFCGREEELADLRDRLTRGEERLVTLLGPGGSGKTRLALEICNRLSEAFGGSVWFVPLADLNAPELMLQALLRALGIEERQQADPVQQVAASLGRRPALLLFDNAEHLLPSCGQQLAELVASCPTAHCLVTSRSRLGVVGEAVVPLHPLPLPPTGPPPAQIVTCASVSLFVDRAQAAAPDFQVTEANAADVARLCVRLEGLPLALELAAAKTATLTPAQILSELTERLELVASPRDRRPERHRSLRIAIAGSVDQLPAEVRSCLLRLAVFRGGWDLPAAEAVGDDGLAADHLAHLVDLSLVTVEAQPGARRFYLLETLREYAWEQVTAGERAAVEERHGEYSLALCHEAVRHLGGRDASAWFARL